MKKKSKNLLSTISLLTISILFLGSVILNISLLHNRKCVINNYSASLRILDKMTDKLTEYALENRKLKKRLTSNRMAISSVSFSE